jgi:hypothetical protein
MVHSRRVSTLEGGHHAIVGCLPQRLRGCLLHRTSENLSSTTFVYKGKRRARRAHATGGPHQRSRRKLAFGGVGCTTAYGTITMSCFLARLVWQRFAVTFASSLGRVPLGATRSPAWAGRLPGLTGNLQVETAVGGDTRAIECSHENRFPILKPAGDGDLTRL